ncbi:hypothetical protein [Micromonospora sp. NBC_00858]|uniref:hypothetical protein n=1 Tax=Micromonospora sp. NBC_00858 TaxID=2975979 RepID=UPI003867895A|nr:hypothetical protein OG990_28060 [Micromonospora sp. NBC_00858]
MTAPSDVFELKGSWISAASLLTYLEQRGWSRVGGREGLYTRLAEVASDSTNSVIVPLNSAMEDYEDLLRVAVGGTAARLGLGEVQLLTELDVAVVGDKVRFRKDVPTPHGSIPWPSGQSLVQAAGRALEAAAKAERQRLAYFGARHRTSAKAYLEAVRMGQTELGSYVVTALTPTEDITGSTLEIPGLTTPLNGRAVAETLVTALSATRDAVDHFRRHSSVAIFTDAIEYGASYELSRSLTGLVERSNGAEVSVSWHAMQGDSELRQPVSVTFEPPDIPALTRASTLYAQTEPPSDVTVLGTVTLLDRPSPGSVGVIRLNVIEGSPANKIRVRIPHDAYDVAIQAHIEGKAIRVSGRQSREGQMYWLYEPSALELVQLPRRQQYQQGSMFDSTGELEDDD